MILLRDSVKEISIYKLIKPYNYNHELEIFNVMFDNQVISKFSNQFKKHDIPMLLWDTLFKSTFYGRQNLVIFRRLPNKMKKKL